MIALFDDLCIASVPHGVAAVAEECWCAEAQYNYLRANRFMSGLT